MSNSRVSNKQLLDAILGLTEAIKAQNTSPVAEATAPVVATEVATDTPAIKVSKQYLSNRQVAAQDHANKVGGTVVLYARQNLRGEHKLAFAQQSRFDTLKDKGLIGPVAVYNPAS